MRRYLLLASLLPLLPLLACGSDPVPSPQCGDGQEDPGEICDDGNTDNGDGCSAECTSEEGPSPRCGDGVRDPLEGCDDGNSAAGDGCSPSCTLESCQNGALDPGEDCDDGNAINNDACPNDCTLPTCGNNVIEPPEECDPPGTSACDANCQGMPFCGNGELEGDEQCDDGNFAPGDGCSFSCVLEVCGDGNLNNAGQEGCDDGNTDDGDGCNASCQVESCGDGILQAGIGETCDDGNPVGGDGCRGNCTTEACGDGIVDPGEACDDGNPIDGDACGIDCTPDTCHDGMKSSDERCWLSSHVYPGGSGTRGLWAGDVDADGDEDVIGWNDNTIMVYDHRQDHSLGARILYTAAQVRGATVADIDLDGDLDIVASRGDYFMEQPDLVVLTNDGAGTFTAAAKPDNPYVSLGLVDLDGDGAPDLMAIQDQTRAPVVRKNLGAGAFGPEIIVAAALSDYIQAGDLDADGDLDLVTYSLGGPALQFHENQGGLAFAAKGTLAIPSFTVFGESSLLVADLSGDGLSDVATFDVGQKQVVIAKNQGSYAFGLTEIASQSFGLPRLVFDVDADGDADLLLGTDVVSSAPHGSSVLVNDGAGNFALGLDLWSNAPQMPGNAVLLDLELDGDADIIVPSWEGINALVNLGAAGYLPRQSAAASGPQSDLAVLDVDGDGDLDTAAASTQGVLLTKNDGKGQSLPAVSLSNEFARVVATGDLNGDGKPDLAVSASFKKLLLFFNDGAGGFGQPVVLSNVVDANREIFLADLDGDGDLDTLLCSTYDAQVLLNDGAGSLAPQPSFLLISITSAVLVDRTGDGKLDLVTGLFNNGSDALAGFRTYPGNGAGGFLAPTTFTTGFMIDEIVAGDVNQDGRSDLLISPQAISNASGLHLYLGTADGGLSAPMIVPAPQQMRAPRLVDLNLDGRLDIALGNWDDDRLDLYFQGDQGQFVQEKTFPQIYSLHDMVVADMNADELPDFVLSTYEGWMISSVLSTP